MFKIFKKILPAVIVFCLIILPQLSFAALVPCGGSGEGAKPCEFKDLVTLFDNVINFLLVDVLAPLGALALAFVGISFLTAQGNPSAANKAKETLWDVLYGILIALAAYAIIETIFSVLTNWDKIPSIL
jgi:hypothetical protein